MNVRKQLNLLWMLVAANALLVLVTYLWFPLDQLRGLQGVSLPEVAASGWQLALANASMTLVLYGFLGRVGFGLARKLDLTGVYRKWAGWRTWFFDPMLTGLGVGVAMMAVDRLFALFGGRESFPFPTFPLSLFASAAVVGEEVLFRMFLLGFLALLLDFLLWRFLGSGAILWIANLMAALAFGAAHLPAVMLLTGASTPAEIPIHTLVELFLVNGLLGLAAGRWYVKEGLVAAVGVHFWAGIVWQVIGPLFYLGIG